MEEILKKLNIIVKKEKLKITSDALELIAASAEGSVRDAESLLDQITSLTDNADLKSVESIIGKVGHRRVAELADYITNADLPKALKYLSKLSGSGANLTDLNRELIHYLRHSLSLKLDPQLEPFFQKELTKEEMGLLKEHAQKIEVDKQIKLIKSLIRAYEEMRYSPFPHIPLEIAIIENLR